MASRNEAESPRCLKNMDDLLRCPICFDFLNIAMMTKCSHNFCSLCIRKNLAIKLHCPVCNSQMTEQDLRNNRTLDEMIVNFQVVRRHLSKAIGDTPPLFPETPPTTAVGCRTTPKKDGSILSHFSQKRPKPIDTTKGPKPIDTTKGPKPLDTTKGPKPIDTTKGPKPLDTTKGPKPLDTTKGPKPLDTTDAQQASLAAPRVPQGNKKTHTQITSNGDLLHEQSAPPALTAEQPMASEVVRAPKRKSIKLENVDLDYPISPPQPSNQNVDLDYPISAPQPSNAETFSPSEDKKPVIKVECPVCSIGIASNFINKHLDTCLASGPKKNSLRSSGGSRMRPLGKLVYHLLSLQKLKKKLKECHLSVDGSREQLERKHKEFVHMYNAQCDSLTPKSAQDVAKEVEANEKTRSQLQRKAKPVMVFSKNQPEAEIDTMHSNYMQAAEQKDCMTSDETGGDVTSDSSVSSSLPDVFEPEPLPKIENMMTRKRASCSREEDAADPLIPLKRKCKTLREDR